MSKGLSKADEHSIECDTRWEHQKDLNERNENQFREIFARMNKIEVRVAAWAAAGSVVATLIGKLF